MPTATKPVPKNDAPARGLFRGRVSAITVVLASMATLAILFGILQSSGTDRLQVQSIPAQPNTVSQSVAAPAKPALPPAQPALPPAQAAPPPVQPVLPPAPLATPAGPAIDSLGFVDSSARCEQNQQAVAIARTAKAAMVVCRKADGTYEYSGIRLRDGASLRLDDVRVIPTGFEAHNEGTTYRLSSTELVVITGEALQSRDAVLEYRAG